MVLWFAKVQQSNLTLMEVSQESGTLACHLVINYYAFWALTSNFNKMYKIFKLCIICIYISFSQLVRSLKVHNVEHIQYSLYMGVP